MMTFAKFSILLLLALAITGCCSVVSQSGDAKVLRCRQLMHSPGKEFFRMELPSVSVAQTGAKVIQVRGLPAYLAGLFKYDVSMPVPYSEIFSDKDAPWHEAEITISYRRMDGTEAFRESLWLGASSHGYSQGHDGWEAGWNLGPGLNPVPVIDDSFDIIVTVEQPSARASDRITISAWAVYCKKP